MPKKLDINPGDRFVRLTVIAEAEKRRNKRHFLCQCDCGKKTIVTVDNLNGGHTKSCGCYCKEKIAATKTKHKGCGSRLYEIWQSMKKRCLNPNSYAFIYYGGRGVKICREWMEFESFRKWALRNGYSNNLTLERIDCNKDYSSDNCLWIPLKEQNNNKTSSRLISYQGKTQSLRDWSYELGINYSTLHGRLQRGWPVEKAFGVAQCL